LLHDSSDKTVETEALLDSGAGGVFIDQNYAQKLRLDLKTLETPVLARNVDGTTNKRGTIKNYVDLQFKIGDKQFEERFFVTGLGRQRIILGFPWLRKHNPEVNWQTGTINWQIDNFERSKALVKKWRIEREEKGKETGKKETDKEKHISVSIIEEVDEEDWKNSTLNPLGEDDESILVNILDMDDREIWINAKTNLAMDMAIEANLKKEELTAEQIVPPEYHEYLDVFDEDRANRFPESRPWDHKIEMKPGFEPKSCKGYNLTPGEQIELDKFLKENLDKGYIRPSQSPMASPFFFVKKKDGKLRPCQDYRYLNDWTIKNAYPLPLISEIMDKIKGAKYFTKLDVRWGYNNIRIKDGDQWKAAFKTNRGLFEPTVMFFGMCNSPATFQAMMDSIFIDMIEGCLVIVYMDDILIFASTQKELERITKQVLQRLREHDLFLKPKKCEFNKTSMEYLGLIIREGQVAMDPVKVKGLQDWPVPTTVKQVRSFLGFGNFYRRFIRKFSELAQPLNNLLKKATSFNWTQECQDAFESMKARFIAEPVLMMPDHSRPFQIESDASKYASGAVLTQLDSNGDKHPIAYYSRTFTQAERNYEIYDRELLGIIRALEEWRHYIQGSGHTTEVYSDHKNLTYFRKAQRLNPRQARWSLYLSEFDLKLIHLPGSKMILSDALSRRPDHCPGDDTGNDDMVLLPEGLFINLVDLELQERIANSSDLDFDATDAISRLLQSGPVTIKNDLEDWKLDETSGKRVLFYKGKNYIPKDAELRRDIVKMLHDHETAGHPGELETFNSVRQHYWWPGMRTFIKNYVKGCGICQQFKIDRSPSHPAFVPVEGAQSTRPFAHCSMDLITDLPPVDGSDSLLVVVDQGLSKGVILIPTTKTVDQNGIGELLHANLYKRFGLPDKIISDRGPQFAAQGFRALLNRLGIRSSLTTAYHPQSDGTTERVNQEIEAYLAIYCHSNPETWKEAIPTLEFTHNNRRHADRLHTPFELMLGDSPKAIPTTFEHSKYPTVEEKMRQLIKDREEALAAHELARTRMAERRKDKFIPFRKGDRVWLDTRNMKTSYHKKMAPKREGPFEVEEVLGPVTYRLKIPTTWRIHNVFHAILLKPYRETEVYGENFPSPPPEIVDGEEVYEVESILKHRRRGRGYQYLVKWVGYPITEASWESEQAFSDDGDMLDSYKLRNQI
jgi:hypothetical protein